MSKRSNNARNKFRQAASISMVFAMVLSLLNFIPPTEADAAGPYLLSQNRPAYSSTMNGNSSPDLAFDGDTGTRWESAWGVDQQWIYVDLGANANITGVTLRWEGAFSTNYKIQTSNDELNWSDAYSVTNGDGAVDALTFTATGRYVRLFSNARSISAYGISLFEFEVYGTGGVNPPPAQLGTNVALNRPVTASSYEVADYLPPNSTLPQLVVDGNGTTRWSSNHTDNEWIYVDLGSVHNIGRVIINWESAAGRTYDIQVSNDAANWTTVYRELHGDGGTFNLPMYASGRYVRMKGISRTTTFGYSIFEFQVYDYVAGDPQPTYSIPALPTASTVAVGQGSYVKDDLSVPQPKYPLYKADNLATPLPSNDWWQSIMINKLGNGIITLPLKNKYTKQGLSVLNPGQGFIANDRTQAADGSPDLYITTNTMDPAKVVNKIIGYGDFSADVSFTDGTSELKTTFVKGSPYLYNTFSNPADAQLYLPATTRFFDDNNNTILTTDGASITADHIGIQVTNSNGAPTPSNVTRYYGAFVPAGTTFTKIGAKIKISLGSGANYMSVATIPGTANLNYFYQHAYAFVTGTAASYSFNDTTSDVSTTLAATTTLKRTGFANTTLMAQLPHQWKITTSPLTALTYQSIRGLMKVTEGNSFTTVNKFYGIVPQFTEPGDSTYSRQTLKDYLVKLDTDTATNLMQGDAYWQGKKLHPLAMGALIADQIGDANYKALFVSRMKTVLSDWYTYTNGEPTYYFDYNSDWGTLIYKNSEFGANSGITDHHFTYGYYVFASAVLASFDQDFRDKYGSMVDMLIRDYANPSKTDPLFPSFRNFDPYEGHSWAGGYADNDSGNNQEAAGESLFGWVGQYLWGNLTGNTAYRNAGIYGFTTELKAVEQYWFNYDQDNWLPGFNHKALGQVYGSSNFFGTFFNGDPVFVYGIHWLPTAEYLTSYGFDPTKVQTMYNGLVADIGGPENDWYHIVWPIQSLFDPQAVLNKFNPTIVQQNELFNTYWFVHSMATLGNRTKDIWATGGASATVYKKGTTYSALVWNPTNAAITVTFRNSGGVTGSATIAPKTLVKVNPQATTNPQNTPPTLTADSTQNNVGQPMDITFTDNATWRGAITAVQVDGTNVASGQYTVTSGKITLNASLFPTAKAYSITVLANGYYAATVSQTVNAGSSGGTNLALNKTVTTSTGALQAGSLAVDGNAGTRWESAFSDPQWISVDLGSTQSVNKVVLNWEGAYGKSYKIEVSTDGSNWSQVYSTTTGAGGVETLTFGAANARYVRLTGTVRGTAYGYSLYEFEVYGSGSTTQTPPTLAAAATTVGSAGTVTFTDNSAWRSAISAVKVDGTTVATNQYTVAAGSITLNASLFSTAKTYAITVQASGYSDASASLVVNAASSGGTNLALNKTVTTSTGAVQAGNYAVDGNAGTRWESASSDPQWISVDLGSTQSVNKVVLNWEGAYGKSYKIEVSTDGSNWSQVYSTTTGAGGVETLTFTAANARYVRLTGTVRGTQYGYSLWELEVYGSGSTTQTPPALTADSTLNNVGQPMDITFTDNSAWRSAISAVKVDGTTVATNQYTVASGKITLNASLFSTAKTYAITVQASGYSDATVSQVVTAASNVNLALNKTVTTSTGALQAGSYAVDGNTGTRWESAFSDPQWISVDLGSAQTISRVNLNWEGAYGKSYKIEVSTNGSTWTQVYSTTTGAGGIENVTFTSTSARYVRLTGTVRGTQYGYSLWEMGIYQ
ncbi:discoidin domain-containing protein [Paenibacillus athensensis]|uniref:glucan endo-1,3-beta-D-glucosidase n=1 Tax=Paenibacillus athensensis TaxID=1967502 RepID=A0A4Y8Q328_9BACL|nr:discoidin domain-containing protein [Paenibacillus athensensis]MCD1259250.1 discoidin domain-containing protein [Paenibacillus athensensis]